jgi:hypothetical protein
MSVNTQKIGVASVRGDGTSRFFDDGFASVAKLGTGVYELTLAGSIPPGETCPLVTPWTNAGAALVPIIVNTTIDAKGEKLTVATYDITGAPVDAAFCVYLYRVITTT